MHETNRCDEVWSDPVWQASHQLGSNRIVKPLIEKSEIAATILVSDQVVCSFFSENRKVLAQVRLPDIVNALIEIYLSHLALNSNG